MNILFATTVLPHGQTTGGEIASQCFIDAMRAAGHQVHVVGFARDAGSVPTGSTSISIRHIETAGAGVAKFRWLAHALLSHQPYVCAKFSAAHYRNQLITATTKRQADVLVLDHAQMGWLLPQARRLARSLVLIAHNHEAALYRAEAAHETNPLRRRLLERDSRLLEHLETNLARAANQVWTLSPAEQATFAALTGPGKTSLLPLTGRSIDPGNKIRTGSFDVGLLGTWSWDVNGRGLNWFMEQVAPLLPPDVRVRIAGRGSERVNGMRANVVGLGFVADPVAFMHEARVLAVPAIAGAGVQLKTIEAIASGTPTVSNTLGLRGIGDIPPYVTIADTPATFAAAILHRLEETAHHAQTAEHWIANRRHAFDQSIVALLARLDQPNPTAALQPAPRLQKAAP